MQGPKRKKHGCGQQIVARNMNEQWNLGRRTQGESWEQGNESKPLKDCDHHYICPPKLEPTEASNNASDQLALIATVKSLCHQASKEFGV
jgi:hypothetical protein